MHVLARELERGFLLQCFWLKLFLRKMLLRMER